jgi:hypothetical protein
MLNVGFIAVLVGVGVGLGLGLPRLSARRGRREEREREHAAELLRHREIIADYEATILAYRRFVHDDPELSMTSR